MRMTYLILLICLICISIGSAYSGGGSEPGASTKTSKDETGDINKTLRRLEEKLGEMDRRQSEKLAEIKGSVNDRLHNHENESSELKSRIRSLERVQFVVLAIIGIIVSAIFFFVAFTRRVRAESS